MNEVSIELRAAGPLKHVGRWLWYGRFTIAGVPGIRSVSLFSQEIRDRRVARRIARKTGMSFSWNRNAVWHGDPK